jgi:hypothetical protein
MTMNKVWFLITGWLLLLALPLKSQEQSTLQKDISFLNALVKQNDYSTAIKYIDKVIKIKHDSITYLKAWIYYSTDQQDSALKYFKLVSDTYKDLLIESRLFSSSAAYFSKEYKTADSILNKINSMQLDSNQMELMTLQKAGIALLKRDYEAYEKQQSLFKYNNYNFLNEEQQLNTLYNELKMKKKKSPAIAALLSAILPGSGKWYAGNRGQAITSFFSFAIPAAIATESYLKAGPKSFLFISSAALTTIFYSGSVVGSAYSVKKNISSFNNVTNEKILLHIHLPLRRFYSK